MSNGYHTSIKSAAASSDSTIKLMTFNSWLIPVGFPRCHFCIPSFSLIVGPRQLPMLLRLRSALPSRESLRSHYRVGLQGQHRREYFRYHSFAKSYPQQIVTLQEVWSGSHSVVASCINCCCCFRMFQRSEVLAALEKSHQPINRSFHHLLVDTHLQYHTRAHGSHICECAPKFLDSGLIIMSKWPILHEEFVLFISPFFHLTA